MFQETCAGHSAAGFKRHSHDNGLTLRDGQRLKFTASDATAAIVGGLADEIGMSMNGPL